MFFQSFNYWSRFTNQIKPPVNVVSTILRPPIKMLIESKNTKPKNWNICKICTVYWLLNWLLYVDSIIIDLFESVLQIKLHSVKPRFFSINADQSLKTVLYTFVCYIDAASSSTTTARTRTASTTSRPARARLSLSGGISSSSNM